jgi:hypothetical protein
MALIDTLILHLNSLFTLSILVWAFSAYTEIMVYRNINKTFETIAKLVHSEVRLPKTSVQADYLLVQGIYKNRKVVCRINRLGPSRFLHYNLSLHCYVEPLFEPDAKFPSTPRLTQHTRLQEDNRIYYQYTSSTALNSYLFSTRISEHEIISILEELTQAAEIFEASCRP